MEDLSSIEEAMALYFLRELEDFEGEAIRWIPLNKEFLGRWDFKGFDRDTVERYLNWLIRQGLVDIRPGHLSYGSRVQVRLSLDGEKRLKAIHRSWKNDDDVMTVPRCYQN